MVIKINKSTLLYTISLIGIFAPVFFSSLLVILIPKVNNRIFLLLCSTVIFLYLQVKRRSRESLPYKVSIILFAFLFITVIGYFKSGDSEYEAFIRFSCIFICMIYGFKDTKWLMIFTRLLLVFSLFYIITTIWLYFDHNSYLTYFANNLYPNEWRFSSWLADGFTAGVTDHYSTNGMVLANALVISFSYAFVDSTDKKKSIAKWIVVILAFVALLLTGKRAHLMFGFISIIAVYIVFQWRAKNRYFKYFVIAFILLISFFLLQSFSPTFNNFIDRFSNMNDDINVTGRYVFWAAAMANFWKHPIFGIGWFGFRNLIAPSVNYSGHCHDIYVQLLCETGIIGVLLFYTFFTFSLICAVKFARYTIKNELDFQKGDRLLSIFSLGYQIYFLLYGITGNPLYDAYNYPVYFVACCISIHYVWVYKRTILGIRGGYK